MQCLDYQICNNQNCWYFVDAHFQGKAGGMSLLLLPVKAANILQMGVCNQSEHKLPKMQSQNFLAFRWRSFSECGGDCVDVSFAYTSCQYVAYG